MSDKAVGASTVLHVNVNTADLNRAVGFYVDACGLVNRMQSRDPAGDWSFIGHDEPVDSEGWFLYDDRGPRAAPALELVGWYRPTLVGTVSPTVQRLGIASIGLEVGTGVIDRPDIAVVGVAGSTRRVVTDEDGVPVELVERGDGPVRLRHIRIGCSDLSAAVAFYSTLGFAPEGPQYRVEVSDATGGTGGKVQAMSLPSRALLIELTQWDAEPNGQTPLPLWHVGPVRFALAVPDLDAAMAVLVQAGYDPGRRNVFALPGTSIGHLTICFLTDPDGLHVELVERAMPG